MKRNLLQIDGVAPEIKMALQTAAQKKYGQANASLLVRTNLNQIARAFNILVNGGSEKMPEIGKKLVGLRRTITAHTGKVLKALNSGTATWEVRQGRNQNQSKKGRKNHGLQR
jgi:hypothetical protein